MPKIYTKETLINTLREIRARGWIKSRRKSDNSGAVGNTLEDLLGIEENNLPLPNAAEWELKVQRKKTGSLLTLFHSEPSPRALKIVPWLLNNYGWRHEKAGEKYPDNEKSFRQTLRYGEKTSRGFSVGVDEANRRIVISFSFDDIKPEHDGWKTYLLNSGRNVLDGNYVPYWGFDDVFHKVGTKLGNCFHIIAEASKEKDGEYFRYSEIRMLSGFSIDRFIEAIKQGYVYIDFDARTGHNHGTKFRINREKMHLLYENVKII